MSVSTFHLMLAKPRWTSLTGLTKQTAGSCVTLEQNERRRLCSGKVWRTQPLGPPIKPIYHVVALGDQKRQHSSASKIDLKAQLSQDGRLTVVTGGSRGIGLHIAECIASLGGDIAILDLMEPQEDMKLIESRYGSRVRFYRTDVSSEAEIEKSFQQVVAQQGNISNCVTAAGIALDKPFLDTAWGESKRVLDINVLGTFYCIQAAVKQMIAHQTRGSIVTIASIAAHGAIPGQTVSIYGASKAAVKLMTKTLAVELAPHGIRLNSISPGFVYTEMSKQFPHLQPLFNSTPPAGRIGQREDMALAVAYLLSPQGADYTTGADVPITGGLHGGRIDV